MQKNIIALAIAAAFAAPAAAMAEATFYGSMDGGVRHQTNDASPVTTCTATGCVTKGGTTDTMQMGQYNTARWGFKGVDDLGDGMKATVALETSFGPVGVGSNSNISGSFAQGTNSPEANPFGLIFDRLAIVGVSGSMGSIDMGWNYTTSFKTIATYDPMNYKFLGVAGAKSSDLRRMMPSSQTSGKSVNVDRAGSVQYTNKFGDVGLVLEYDVNNGDKTTQPAGGVARAIGLTYATGPVNVGFAYTAVEPSAGQEDKVAHMTVGAGFNFGDGKVSVGYAKNTIAAPSTPAGAPAAIAEETDTNMWAGVSYNITSATAVSAAYYKNAFVQMGSNYTATGLITAPEATKNTIIVAATYALSKKTNLYFEMDRSVSNAGSTGAKDATTIGTAAGLNTAF